MCSSCIKVLTEKKSDTNDKKVTREPSTREHKKKNYIRRNLREM